MGDRHNVDVRLAFSTGRGGNDDDSRADLSTVLVIFRMLAAPQVRIGDDKFRCGRRQGHDLVLQFGVQVLVARRNLGRLDFLNDLGWHFPSVQCLSILALQAPIFLIGHKHRVTAAVFAHFHRLGQRHILVITRLFLVPAGGYFRQRQGLHPHTERPTLDTSSGKAFGAIRPIAFHAPLNSSISAVSLSLSSVIARVEVFRTVSIFTSNSISKGSGATAWSSRGASCAVSGATIAAKASCSPITRASHCVSD